MSQPQGYDTPAVTLREFISEIIKYEAKHTETRLQAVEDKETLAAEVINERLKSMNEFRDAMKDQQDLFARKTQIETLEKRVDNVLTRPEYEAKHERILADLQSLNLTRASLDAKASTKSVSNVQLLTILGLIIAFGGFMVASLSGLIAMISIVLRLFGY
jgi:hypothetical protein